ncbi:transmembrane protein 26-like [Pelodytes ibericus]
MDNPEAHSSDTISTLADSETVPGICKENSTADNSILDQSEASSRAKAGSLWCRCSATRRWAVSSRLGRGLKVLNTYRRLLLAIMSRLLFTAHGIMMVWLLTEVKGNPEYWILLVGLLGLYIEMVITLFVTKKGEWKWFSPMVFIYLCVALPCIFVSELDLQRSQNTKCNLTVTEVKHESLENTTLVDVFEKQLDIRTPCEWLDIMEQLMILVLILGRWIMPKGSMNRDQLTQLLLLYISLGADILDLLQLIKGQQMINNENVAIVGLSLFSWASFQFSLVLTQSSSKKKDSEDSETGSTKKCNSSYCTSEVWHLVIAVAMQDGPFLIYRLYLLGAQGVQNKTLIFFICKNLLTVTIEVYRIVLVLTKQHNSEHEN